MSDPLFDVNKPRTIYHIPVDDLPVSVRPAFLALRKGDADWWDKITDATVGDIKRLLTALAEAMAERALDSKYEALVAETDREQARVALNRTVPLAESADWLAGFAIGMERMSRILAPTVAALQAKTVSQKAQLTGMAQLLTVVREAPLTVPDESDSQ